MLRRSPLGTAIEHVVLLVLIGQAVVKVAERVDAFRTFTGAGDCGCLEPDTPLTPDPDDVLAAMVEPDVDQLASEIAGGVHLERLLEADDGAST